MKEILLNCFRIKKRISLFWLITDGVSIIYSHKFFGYVYTKEQKIKYRIAYFDDGITYTTYWGEWKERYKFIEIIKK